MTARRLAGLTEAQRREVLAGLSQAELEALAHEWRFWARDDQLPPPQRLFRAPWRTWLLLGGRGSGKTRSAAEWVRAEAESGRRRLIGCLGPTSDSVRREMIEGSSGLLAIAPPGNRPEYEPSTRRVIYGNGAIVHLFSAEEPQRLRGPNLDGLWIDELCAMSNAPECWDLVQMALRVPGPLGDAPCAVISTTPKPSPLLKQIMEAKSTVITHAKTSDNMANLDASTLAYLHEKYGGTRLGRQELDAEVLEDLEGALWSRSLIDASRIRRGDVPEKLARVVVAVDPPGGSSKTNAECGIVVAAKGADRQLYVLADLSRRMSPETWACVVVGAYKSYRADKIVAEQNFGGAMVESTIRSVDRNVPVKMVTASRGKQLRAEPLASLYEQHRVHHVGELPTLEDQMCTWDPQATGPSPDRLDALVWALTELSEGPGVVRFSPEAIARIEGNALPGTAGWWARRF